MAEQDLDEDEEEDEEVTRKLYGMMINGQKLRNGSTLARAGGLYRYDWIAAADVLFGKTPTCSRI